MLKIKLARFGKKHQPHFRIVVNEARDKRDGKYVAKIGHYAPTLQPKILQIDVKAYQEWLKKGAQPTETVAGLFKRFQSDEPFPVKKRISKKAKAKLNQPKEEVKAVKEPAAEEAPAAAKPEQTPTQEETAPKEPKTEK